MNDQSIEDTDEYGMTPIMHAAEYFDYEALAILLEQGADPHKCDNDGKTPLMFLCQPPDNFYMHFYNIYRETFKLLFDKNVDINAKDNKGNTALHHACVYLDRTFEIIELLLENGADVNSINNHGESALMNVCCGMYCYQRKKIIQLLLNSGADVNKIDNDGETALNGLYRALNEFRDNDDDCDGEIRVLKAIKLLKQYGAIKHGIWVTKIW